jgi:two-component sensor histidine kinase
VPESVRQARHAVTSLAGAVDVPSQEVALAVSEAVGNAVMHAFPRGTSGTIAIRARVDGNELIVTVADDGVGMVPDLEQRGLGVGASLISRLSREATFESSSGGTTVTMRFNSTGGARE